MRNYQTNKIAYKFIHETWSIDLAEFLDYKTTNIKRFRYTFVIIDNFSKYLWAIPLKNKYSQTITDEFPNFLSTSKRPPVKLESDRGAEFHKNIFQNFLKSKHIHQYSRFTDKGPSIAERVIRSIPNLLKKPVFEKRNANWLSELPSVLKKYNNTIHHNIKLTPLEASLKKNKKLVYLNLKENREVQKPKRKPGQLVRTVDIKRVFSKGDGTNYSYKLYTITENIHDTIPSYRINFSPERYEEHLLRPTKLNLEENNQVMKKLNLIQ